MKYIKQMIESRELLDRLNNVNVKYIICYGQIINKAKKELYKQSSLMKAIT